MDVGTLAKSRYVSLTTFRRDGAPVATPVWVAHQGDELVVYTASSFGKAKRLRNCSRVLVAPCDMGGRPTGDAIEGTARLQDESAPREAWRIEPLIGAVRRCRLDSARGHRPIEGLVATRRRPHGLMRGPAAERPARLDGSRCSCRAACRARDRRR